VGLSLYLSSLLLSSLSLVTTHNDKNTLLSLSSESINCLPSFLCPEMQHLLNRFYTGFVPLFFITVTIIFTRSRYSLSIQSNSLLSVHISSINQSINRLPSSCVRSRSIIITASHSGSVYLFFYHHHRYYYSPSLVSIHNTTFSFCDVLKVVIQVISLVNVDACSHNITTATNSWFVIYFDHDYCHSLQLFSIYNPLYYDVMKVLLRSYRLST